MKKPINNDEIEKLASEVKLDSELDVFGTTTFAEAFMFFIAGILSLIPIVWIVSFISKSVFDIIVGR